MRVIYTQEHYEYLVRAGKRPSKYANRENVIGVVVDVIEDAQLIRVAWGNGVKVHFASNLEEVSAT